MVPGIEQGAKTARPEGSGCPARSVTQIKERKSRRPTCSAGVPNTLTHRSPDLTDDWGCLSFGQCGGNAIWCISASLPATTSHVRKSQCHYVIASQPPCHLHGSLVSYITLLPPYSHCVSTLPYHSITKSHSPCISVATSHCHHVTCHHCLSGVLQVRLTAAENKTSRGVIHSQ